MTTADDRYDEDVWAQAVAEGAKAGATAGGGAGAEKAADRSPAPGSAESQSESGPDAALEETRGKREEVVQPRQSTDLFGPELSPLVDEVRRFATSVGEKVTEASASFSSGDSLGALQNLAAPLRVKHPEVYGHLIAAGGELIAAYRSAVSASERRWTAEKRGSSEQIDLD
ncbi:DUF5304 family protein [Streptacidiphilus sp. N1-3]|uniref:DUF5304 family protein n=1 Tax=Streptacidiphilus alkalitolerans TaxID=3342712 RepID=A0ABV6XCX3_9ACTN